MEAQLKEKVKDITRWQKALSIKDWNEISTSPSEKLQAVMWSMKIGKSKQESFFDLTSKLRLTIVHAQELLGKEPKMSLAELYAPIMFVLNSFEEYQAVNPSGVRDIALSDGAKPVSKASLREVDKFVDFADIAYDDRPKESLVEFLTKNGYTLCYYDHITDHEQAAHYLAFNPNEKTVVVGIKGTSTLKDVFTDILCRTSAFLPSTYAHDGIMIAARRIVLRIHSFIENLFIPLGYRIVCTGHSLGAGVACLTAMILHDELHISNVRAYAYATPPVLDKTAALGCKDYVISVVHERDIISRTSLSNMNIMHETLFQVAQMIKVGKLNNESIVKTDHGEEDDPITGLDLLEKVRSIQKEYKLDYEQDLYVPGRVLYMFKGGNGRYEVLEKDGTLTGLRTMLICKTMFSDHAVMQYINAVDELLSSNRVACVTSPLTNRENSNTQIRIDGYQSFMHPFERKNVVYYEISTNMVEDDLTNQDKNTVESSFGFVSHAVKHFSSWRRYNEFADLDNSLDALGISAYLPSKYFRTEPDKRLPLLEEYLNSITLSGMKQQVGQVTELIMDFLGAGKTSAAPRFIVRSLAFGTKKEVSDESTTEEE